MTAVERDNLQAEVNFLRRANMHAEAMLGCAAAMATQYGAKAEAVQFASDAAYLRTVRHIVQTDLPRL